MSRLGRIAALLAGAGFVWLVAQQVAEPAGPTLAALAPAGALLALETPELGRLLADWSTSATKQRWMGSVNRQVFLQSRLGIRLNEAAERYGTAAGFRADLRWVQSIAGEESLLALYDIGRLEFLYLSRMPTARALQSALAQTKGSFQQRTVAGRPFFLRVDAATQTTAAFAIVDNLLLVSTRQDLLARALERLAGQNVNGLADEAWYRQCHQAARPGVALRLAMNLAAVTSTPYFRSYWIQGNRAELNQYAVALTELTRQSDEWTELRTLWRREPGEFEVLPGVELSGLVPVEAGVYRDWTAPTSAQVSRGLERVLAPRLTNPAPAAAPPAAPALAMAGTEDDLEQRLDQAPPVVPTAELLTPELLQTLGPENVAEMMLVGQSRAASDQTLVRHGLVLALKLKQPVPAAQFEAAVSRAAGALYTSAGLGTGWRDETRAGQTMRCWNGLRPLALRVRGPIVLLGNDADLLAAVLTRSSGAATAVSYAAAVRWQRELPLFRRLMEQVDAPARPPAQPGTDGREPLFFSENLASLGLSLGQLKSMEVKVEDRREVQRQTVRYQWLP